MAIEPRATKLTALIKNVFEEQAKTPPTLLKEAEAAAATRRGATKPSPDPYRFAINYTLDSKAKSPKGDYSARYNALVALVKVLGPTPWHYATSSWEVHSHQSRQEVLAALSAPLDARIDVLTVTPVGPSAVFGDTNKL